MSNLFYFMFYFIIAVVGMILLPCISHSRFVMCYRKIDLKRFSCLFYDKKRIGTKIHIPVFVCELINYILFIITVVGYLVTWFFTKDMSVTSIVYFVGLFLGVIISIIFMIFYAINNKTERARYWREPEELENDYFMQSQKEEGNEKSENAEGTNTKK